MGILNHKIKEVWYTSFYINNELNCEMILLHLKSDDKWFKVSICDGEAEILLENHEPKNEGWEHEGDVFKYLVSIFDKIDIAKYGNLTKVEEYLYEGKEDECCGLLFTFENDNRISLIENNDCLLIKDGVENKLLKNCVLQPFNNSL